MFFFCFFGAYNLGFFSVGFSPSKVTKDMIGEASGSDLILPSEEVWKFPNPKRNVRSLHGCFPAAFFVALFLVMKL